MSDVVGTLLRAERLQEFTYSSPCCFHGSFVRLSDERLELGEHHLDGIEVWTVWRQEEEVRADITDRIAGRLSFVTSQIVEDDDIASLQRWHQALLDPCCEGDAIDGAIKDEGGDDAVVAQAGQESQRLPMTVGNFCNERLSALTPAAGARHIGLDPGLVDEDEPLWIKPMLMGLPSFPKPGHLRAVLLARHQRFF